MLALQRLRSINKSFFSSNSFGFDHEKVCNQLSWNPYKTHKIFHEKKKKNLLSSKPFASDNISCFILPNIKFQHLFSAKSSVYIYILCSQTSWRSSKVCCVIHHMSYVPSACELFNSLLKPNAASSLPLVCPACTWVYFTIVKSLNLWDDLIDRVTLICESRLQLSCNSLIEGLNFFFYIPAVEKALKFVPSFIYFFPSKLYITCIFLPPYLVCNKVHVQMSKAIKKKLQRDGIYKKARRSSNVWRVL